MRAVILAAGEGMRLRPLTTYTPKPMLPVGNKPILQHIVEALAKEDVRDITMVVGYKKERIMGFFGDGSDFGVHIEYAIQRKQLGTAHALLHAKPSDDFILLPGDNIVDPQCIHSVKSKNNSILAVHSYIPSKYGVVEIKKKRARIIRVREVEDQALVFTGIGHFTSELFTIAKSTLRDGFYDITDAINRLDVNVVVSSCTWLDAVYPWDLLNLNWKILKNTPKKIAGKIEHATIIGKVQIGDGAVIGAGTYIKGPVVIGRNCTIGPNSVIMPGTSIGDGTQVGAMSYVENSILMENSVIDVGARIRNSIVGNAVNVGFNAMLLSGKIKKISGTEIVEREDVGAVIGDNTQIGSGVSIAPGTMVGADAKIEDCAKIHKDVENCARVI